MKYILSDTHFDHGNIIKYCERPFTSLEQMNEELRANWNRTIDADDRVIFLGDLTIAGTASAFLKWIEQLHGEITFVVGDHDDEVIRTLDRVYVCDHYQFSAAGYDFYCIHRPEDAPANWDGWVLHGHHHNNWPDEFPFVNPRRMQVNVSVELLDYSPLPLPELCAYLDRAKWLQSRPAKDDRPNSLREDRDP